MSASSSRTLFRNLQREAKNIMDYNFRNYAIRRMRLGFNVAKESGKDSAIAYQEGMDALKLLRRQAAISQMYGEKGAFVMDVAKKGSIN